MDHKTQKRLITGILNDDDNTVREIIGACFESEYGKAVSEMQQSFFESLGTKQEATA